MAKTPTDIRSLARAHTGTAIRVLAGIMEQPEAPPAARVSAAQALLDRGWGKPTQPISGDDDASPLKIITRIELVASDGHGQS
jgi:hypothetical protein